MTTDIAMLDRRRLVSLTSAWALAPGLFARRALAQAWPSRYVRLIVPFTPGGANDVIARAVAGRLSELWGQQLVIENKGGAGGNIGIEAAARSTPDGYTMLFSPTALAINPFLYPAISYDPVADFAPVTLLCLQPNIMVVPVSLAVHSVAEFIAYAKKNSGKITYASAGPGTTLHLSGELFKRVAGIEMTHVPYRGTAPALNDLIPGRMDVMFSTLASVLGPIQSGLLRPLAVTTRKRVATLQEVPTVAESGLSDFDVSSWFSFFVPARTPADIIQKMHADSVTALAHPSVKEKLEQLGSTVVGSSPAELAAVLKSEMEKWGPIIRDAGIKPGE
jgi:tripartite-type tricarboxylate transporter receptor subunit TctC